MKTLFILNPWSGHNRRRPWLADAIRELISTHALDARLATTDGPGHATALARDAVQHGCELVVAAGGDGTMNEVARALVHTPAALGLVPCGSGNGLARHLGVPLRPLDALRLAAGREARIVSVDTGLVNGRPFFNAMGLGLDADVSRRFNRLTRRGLLAYARVAFSALRELRPERCAITCRGSTQAIDTLLVAVANSDQYGNHARIAPGARVDDGILDLVAVKSASILATAALVPRLFLGTLDASPQVVRMTGRRFTIERPAAGFIHTDGETHLAGSRVDVSVQPLSLRILVPAGSRATAATPAASRTGALANS